MSNLNPNAPSFSVGNPPPQNSGNNGNQGYSNNSSGGMMPNDGYGSGGASGMMYDNNGPYPPQGGGGGGGRNNYGGGSGYGGGNSVGGGYGPNGGGGGYMNNGPPQNYSQGQRMSRPGNRGVPGHAQHYHNSNSNMMNNAGGGGGGPGMRPMNNYRNNNNMGPYHGNGGGGGGNMDPNGGYDHPPPQHMPSQHPMRSGGMGMNSNMMGGGGRMPPMQQQQQQQQYPNSHPRGPMPMAGPNMGAPQGGHVSGHSSAPPPPMAAPPTPPAVAPAVAAPSYTTKNAPRVVMVVGYKQTGKSSVAQAIARKEGFEYVCLKAPQPEGSDPAEEDDAEEPSAVDRLARLRAVLERKASLKGIVLDDPFSSNRFHAHYIMHYLVEAGLQLDAVVALVPELSLLAKRKVRFTSSRDKVAHPEAFEFASSLDQTNVVALVEDMELKELVERATADLSALLKANHPAIELDEEFFIPQCPLVTDPEKVEEILAAERAALKRELPYSFTYSEPNYVLDYVQFVQSAARLQFYQVTPWVWGDKVSLIGYDGSVYVHLTSYNLVFELEDLPTALLELVKKLKAEAEAAGPCETPESRILFSVEASMLDDVIYISDMMLIGQQQGGEMILHDRIKLLNECFGKLPASGSVRLLEHFPVSDIKKCLDSYSDIGRGAIFVNPNGVEYGRYDIRNFVYPSEAKKTVRLRIWDGHMADDTWNFDGYVREYEDEVLATSGSTGSNSVPVVISDAAVDENVINDGNIVECVMEKIAAKGKSREKSAVLNFCRRCKWEVTPITHFYMWAFADPPQWATESFLDACSTISAVRPTA